MDALSTGVAGFPLIQIKPAAFRPAALAWAGCYWALEDHSCPRNRARKRCLAPAVYRFHLPWQPADALHGTQAGPPQQPVGLTDAEPFREVDALFSEVAKLAFTDALPRRPRRSFS